MLFSCGYNVASLGPIFFFFLNKPRSMEGYAVCADNGSILLNGPWMICIRFDLCDQVTKEKD